MPVSRQQVDAYNFVHTHDIVIQDELPTFRRCRGDMPMAACIYMWLSPQPDAADTFDTLYVGKAGYGVERRQRQHRGGFQHSGTGRANRVLITDWLASGRTLQVYARLSASQTIFGSDASLYSAEEAAACDAFEPRWNRANFPRALGAAAVEQAPEFVPENNEANVERMPLRQPIGQEDQIAARVALAVLDIPQGDEVTAFVESQDADTKVRFLRAMKFIQERAPVGAHKMVGGYTDQPSGYSNKPMLVFGQIRESDRRAVNWYARVPLINEGNTPFTIIFHPSLLNPAASPALVAVGRKGAWRPIDLDALLTCPEEYLR